jgi:hypothetical protein
MAIAIPESATMLASTPVNRMTTKVARMARGRRKAISREASKLSTMTRTTRRVIMTSWESASSSVPSVSWIRVPRS